MASDLPTLRRYKFEDYEGAPQWFATFLQALNLFTNPVWDILNGGVTYENLTIPQIVTKTITAGTTTTFNFINPLRIAANAVMVGQVFISSNMSSHPATIVQVMWHESNSIIYVDSVIGLVSGTLYTLKLVVL